MTGPAVSADGAAAEPARRRAILNQQAQLLYTSTAVLAVLSVAAVAVSLRYGAGWYTLLLPALLAASLVGYVRRQRAFRDAEASAIGSRSGPGAGAPGDPAATP